MFEQAADDLSRDIAAADFGIGRWIWDLDGGTITWSPEQRAIFGLEEAGPEVSVARFCDLVHPEDRARVVSTVTATLSLRRSGHSQSFRILRADGGIRRILSHARLELDEAGRPARLHGLDCDITEVAIAPTPAAETARPPVVGAFDGPDPQGRVPEDREALLRLALGAGRMAVWDLDLGRQVVRIDESLAALFGVPGLPREIPVGFFDAAVDPEDLDRVMAAKAAALRGEAVQVEFRIRLPGGQRRWLRSLGEAQLDGSGRPQRVVGVIHDISTGKAAEERLRASEEHYRDVFAAIDEGFCICDMITDAAGKPVDYRFVEANPLFGLMTGLPDAVGRTALELVPGLERHWIDTYARVGLDRETLRFEMSSEAMGRWFDVFATPLSVPGRFALVFKDVTERKRAEDALVESEARFRHMADDAPVMVWLSDATGACTFMSRSWTAFTGQPVEGALVWGWTDMVHPEDRPASVGAFLATREDFSPCRIEYRLRRADGSYCWVLDSAQPRFDAEGRFAGHIGSVLDLSDRRAAEDALRESEALFRTVTEVMPQMVWSARPDGQPDFFNRRWHDFVGPSAPEGAGWEDVFHPDDRAGIGLRWSRALSTGDPYEVECRMRHAGGGYRWVLCRAVPVRGEDGRILRWMGTCTDIHDMKLAQERQQLMLEEMEHRVKNILALVQAVARQTFSVVPEAAEARDAFSGRLSALSCAYSHLNRESWSQAPLRQIVLGSLEGCGARTAAVVLEGPDIMLPPRTAVTISMAIHELGTNGMKYGALSVPDGRVAIRWQLTAPGRLHLVWQERGGPPVPPPTRRGFGTRMIEQALAAEMEGSVRLRFDPEGVTCEMEAAIDPTVPSAAG
ncbi:PAS domain-containing protein [Cereibacter sphaeroides]|uniref:PAS domain-containing protein n=1 Tax=Cereibacter sphaeroides TaxID=1063 RepID=UPI001F463658|nr:PAS domain-containing protein [Cereibacter sphaeroides]MCE6968759.1 PAS domain-containing protein [Cereibacter sphaeroides]